MRWPLILSLLMMVSVTEAQYNTNRWRITKPQWTARDETNFSAFITRIGMAVERRECLYVDTCLQSPANLYYGTDLAQLRLYADCADLPYYLRSYFAWKNGLPMAIQSGMAPRDSSDNRDIRYTRFGNYVTDRYSIVASRWGAPNAVDLLNRGIVNTVFSASFRVLGAEENLGLSSDFYPIKLGREAIRPGTVIYDPNGHVAIVYKITDDGRIFYIDSHPDNTLTAGMYTPKFSRSFPFHGAGFKNFRPLALVGARMNYNREYVGGRVVGARNSSLPHYSLEQYYGNQPDPNGDWKKGLFIYKGVPFGYYDYLRIVMAHGDLRIDPLMDIRQNVADLCTSMKDRVVAIGLGVNAQLDRKQHPERLPTNIYGTDGEWEDYATPARDARLKVSFMDLLSQTRQLLQRHRAGDPAIVYQGENLAADMLETYQREAQACEFSYVNSAGTRVTMNLEDARHRLFDLSFDPYHCVELRWGASSEEELASCQDDPVKREWYSRERWLRYQWERRFDVRMNYSLEELTGPFPGVGVARPPDVDIVGYLTTEKQTR